MSEYLAHIRAQQQLVLDKVKGDKAADVIVSSSGEDASIVGFDEAEGQRLRVQLGNHVAIAPTDNGMSCLSLLVQCTLLVLMRDVSRENRDDR